MSAKVGLSFLIGGIVGSSFKSSITNVKDNIISLSDKIKGIAQVKLDIASLSRLSEQGKAGTAEFAALETKLKKSGINTANLSGELLKIKNHLLGLKKANVIDIKLKSNIDDFKRSVGSLKGVIATGAAMGGAVYAQSDVLQAQGEIKSLGISSGGIEQITAAAKKFSNQYAGTTAPDFIRASYDIKSGISSLTDSGVAEFTRLAALTGQATKSTTADMTKLFAMGFGIFRKEFSSDEEFANKFSNIISASVQAFRTDGPDLIQGISNLGASATSMGVSLTEQLAIIGTSKEAFNSASDAATGYRAFLAGVGKAQKALGLEFTDAEGKMLPMVDILGSIKEKYGDTMESVATKDELKTAFGSEEAVKTIAALINKTESLRTAEKNLKKDMEEGTKTDAMAKAMQMGKELQLLKQQFINFSASIGSMLYPAFNIFITIIGGALKGISGFINEYKILAKVIGWVVSGILVYITVLKSAILVQKIFGIINLLSAKQVFLLRGGMAKLTLSTRIATLAQFAFNTALRANPIGLIITGIMALIGVGIALYKNWDAISNFFKGMWDKIKAAFSTGINGLITIIMGIVSFILTPFRLFHLVVSYIATPFEAIINILGNVWETIKSLFSGSIGFISNLLSGVIDLWLAPFKGISKVISNIKKLIFGDENTPQHDFNKLGIGSGKNSPKNTAAAIQREDIINKYYGPDGIVARHNNTVNKDGNITYSQNITIQGNADKEQVTAALNEGQTEFERRYNNMTSRKDRLSYEGGG